MTSPRSSTSQAGFTLVEVLIAIVILSFGLMAVANLLVVATGSNGIANNATASAIVAAQQMELLKAKPFTTLVAGGSIVADQAGFFTDTTLPGVGDIHTRWQLTQIDPDTFAITVQSEGLTRLARSIARSSFTSIRACTSTVLGCP
jgi:type IV pilus assembly protein PilV